jgi:hypothetical protein
MCEEMKDGFTGVPPLSLLILPKKEVLQLFLREELVDWCLLNVDNTFVGKNEAYRKLYQREGREDVLTKIHLTDLKELNSFKLLRYATT